jgi:hypothetical protein
MNLLEKLKSLPKKALIIIGILALMLTATIIISVVIASQPQDIGEPTGSGTREPENINVFKPTDNTQGQTSVPEMTDPPTDVSGLSYISKGDGTCYIVGMGTCTETELEIPTTSPTGDRVTKIHEGAFSGCTSLVSVFIPSTVKAIGTGAFRGCTQLVAINVDADNPVYCSVGSVLFSKDKSVLVCYPMNRQGQSYLLNTSVRAIGAYAFDGIVNLRKILYEGNIAKFQAIDVLIGNDSMIALPITCNYVPAK